MSGHFAAAAGWAVVALVLLVGWAAGPARAASITNGSFESGSYDDAASTGHVQSLPVGSTAITGWTVVSGEIGWARNDNPFAPGTATDGTFLLDLTGFHDSTPYGGVSQTITTTSGTAYALTFDLISYESDSRYRSPVGVLASAGSTSQQFTFTAPVGSTGPQSGHFTLPFTADGSTTTVTITGTVSGGGQLIGLDNVAIPEPAGAGLLLLGGGCMIARRRRRR